MLLIGIAIVLIAMERLARGRARFTQSGSRVGLHVQRLRGARAAAASTIGWTMFTVAVALPVYRLITWALEARRTDQTATVAGDLGFHLMSSLRVAAIATVSCLALGVLLVAGLNRRRAGGSILARLATLGYAVPGPVVAIGVLVTLAAIDRTGWLPDGWLLVGSFVGLIYALVVRFLAVAYQGIESSVGKVSPSVVASARTLGAGRFRVATRIELPLAGAGIIAASVLVAIDTLKELPITLLLRPFGTETLPIWVWQATSESLWVQAAVPSLAIVAVGMAARRRAAVDTRTRCGDRVVNAPTSTAGRHLLTGDTFRGDRATATVPTSMDAVLDQPRPALSVSDIDAAHRRT